MITRADAIQLGARFLPIVQVGLRESSFAYLRGGGVPVPTLPVMVAIWPDGLRSIVDGRHRIHIERERGHREIEGVLLGYGKRGGIRWRYHGRFPI